MSPRGSITIDAEKRTIDLELPKSEIASRLKKWRAPKPRYTRGVLAKYASHVSCASEGKGMRSLTLKGAPVAAS